jgi:hypothetical protein
VRNKHWERGIERKKERKKERRKRKQPFGISSSFRAQKKLKRPLLSGRSGPSKTVMTSFGT